MRFVTIGLDILGGIGIVAGCLFWSVPAACIAAGVFCLAFAYTLERGR